MFLKSIYNSLTGSNPPLDKTFWQLYRARCDFYICNGIKDLSSLKLKIKSASLRFIDNEADPYMYGIVISDPNTANEPLMFPLTDETKIIFCFDEESYAVDYFLRIDDELTLMFKFLIKNKDFLESGQFKEIIGRLFYQAKYKKPIALCENEEIFYERVMYMADLNNNGSGIKPKKINPKDFERKQNDSSNELKELFTKMKNLGSTKYVQCGQLELQVSDTNSSKFEIKEKEALLMIHEQNQFQWELRVINLIGDVLTSTILKEGFLYNIDRQSHLITWAGMVEEDIKCCRFKFSKTTDNELTYIIPALILQTSQKKTLEDIVKKNKNDWDQFYLMPENIQKVDQEKIGKYIDQGRDIEIEFDSLNQKMNNLKIEEKISENNPIQNFVQLKNNPLLLVSKKMGLEKYKFDDMTNEMKFDGSIPIVKLYNKDSSMKFGKELILQEGDKRMIFTGHSNKDEVFYTDVETGKVVAQYEHKNANDVSRIGGKSAYQGPSSFLLLDPKGVSLYDTRTTKGVIKDKIYKSKVEFTRLFSGPNNSYAVGSFNGDIRLFSEVGKNAQNLIPSLLGNSILDIDASSNGDFVLATCSKYLLLLPTFQNGCSGFSKRFLKKEKPHPKILRLDPSVITKIGLDNFNFRRGKFDEKDGQEESLIIGTANDFIVVWILEDVLSGKYVSKTVQKIQGGVVEGQFRRNQDWVIAALKNDLKIQKTTSKRNKGKMFKN
jgi:hypothetical protein